MIKRGLRRNILIGVSAIALSFMFVSTWGVSVHASEASREIGRGNRSAFRND